MPARFAWAVGTEGRAGEQVGCDGGAAYRGKMQGALLCHARNRIFEPGAEPTRAASQGPEPLVPSFSQDCNQGIHAGRGGQIQEGVVCSYNTVTSKHGVQFSCTGPGASTSPTEVSVDFFRDTVVSCEPRLQVVPGCT